MAPLGALVQMKKLLIGFGNKLTGRSAVRCAWRGPVVILARLQYVCHMLALQPPVSATSPGIE